MVLLGLWSLLASLVVAGGITFLFRTSETGPRQMRVLFAVGVISATSVVATSLPSTLLGGSIPMAFVVLALPLPGFLAILAGLEFRRAYHTGGRTFFPLFGLIFAGLAMNFVPALETGWSLAVEISYKIILCSFLAHAAFSFWGGRNDDTNFLRRRDRYILTFFTSATITATLLFAINSVEVALLLVGLWITTAYAVRATHSRKQNSPFANYDEKLEELKALFERRRIDREDDLSLERIGDRLLLSNDEVRQLIHSGLGFDRLSNLLDHYRIGSAKLILADPDQAEMRLEEIAISVGYGSLAPFASAFRRLVGKTAQDYRQHYVNQADANRPLQLTNSDR